MLCSSHNRAMKIKALAKVWTEFWKDIAIDWSKCSGVFTIYSKILRLAEAWNPGQVGRCLNKILFVERFP